MPIAKKRRSPLDRFTDASPTAISAGFSAAMSIGPQPRMVPRSESGTSLTMNMSSPMTAGMGGGQENSGFGQGLTGDISNPGTTWLQSLQSSSGLGAGAAGASGSGHASNFNGLGATDDENDSDENPTTAKGARKARKPKATKRKKGAEDDDAMSPAGPKVGDAAGDDDEAAVLRKAQNRIAQREFRQRKQQYIRALEARVELLSTDHDEQVDRLRFALRGLLSENNTLRSLLGSLGRFIGEGLLGGPLQQAGLSREELFRTINGRSEKTMTDAWQNWPGAKECEALRQLRQEANIPVDGLPELRGSPGPFTADGGQRGAKSSKRREKPTTVEGSTQSSGSGSRDPQQSDTPQSRPPPGQDAFDPANGFNLSFLPSVTGNINSNFSHHPNPPSSTATPSSLSILNSFTNQMPSDAFSMSDQGDALMASLFGVDALGDGSHTNPFLPEDFRSNDLVAASSVGPGSLGPSTSQQQPRTSTVGPSPLPRRQPNPSNGASPGGLVPVGAHAFLDSLRDLQDDSDFQRITSLSTQLTRVRAAQGRTDFLPVFHPDPASCDRATNLSDVATHDGGTPQSEEDMHRMTQACIRMAYEMSNYRRNASYILPPLLRPTQLQLTRPHDPIIDSAPFPSLRDALIINTAKLNLDEVLFTLLSSAKVGEGDVFCESTYQLDHAFLLKYPSLATKETMAATNRWRRGHEMAPLSIQDINALSGSGMLGGSFPGGGAGGGGAAAAAAAAAARDVRSGTVSDTATPTTTAMVASGSHNTTTTTTTTTNSSTSDTSLDSPATSMATQKRSKNRPSAHVGVGVGVGVKGGDTGTGTGIGVATGVNASTVAASSTLSTGTGTGTGGTTTKGKGLRTPVPAATATSTPSS